jgi:hypothetical protein
MKRFTDALCSKWEQKKKKKKKKKKKYNVMTYVTFDADRCTDTSS